MKTKCNNSPGNKKEKYNLLDGVPEERAKERKELTPVVALKSSSYALSVILFAIYNAMLTV